MHDSQPTTTSYRLRILANGIEEEWTRDAWSRDVTKDIADELRRRLVEYADVPVSVQAFVEARRLITHATVTTSAISRCC